MFKHMDLNGDGTITYNEFVVFVRDANWRDIEAQLRRMIVAAANKFGSRTALHRAFTDADRDGTFHIIYSHFQF